MNNRKKYPHQRPVTAFIFSWQASGSNLFQLRLIWEFELHSTSSKPWLDVEIAHASRSIARVRQADLKLGKRLEIQLRLAQQMAYLLAPRFIGQHIKMQLHDEDPGVGCLRMDAPVGADLESSPLIPDPYCLGTNGYEGFREQLRTSPLPAWRDRLPVVFWRGSTTGSKDITPDNLEDNLRYQLCRHSISEPSLVDARFNQVVQCLNDENSTAVHERLRKQGLIGVTVGPWQASLHAWLIDIDGNVNSWGLLWKLLSGCCVLRVESHRQQWFHKHMVPWTHVVPIAPTSATCVSELTGASTTVDAVNRLQQLVNN